MSNQTVVLHLHHSDAAEIEAACRRASACHTQTAEKAASEAREQYHRRMAARCAELADLVKTRSAARLAVKEPIEAPDPEEKKS